MLVSACAYVECVFVSSVRKRAETKPSQKYPSMPYTTAIKIPASHQHSDIAQARILVSIQVIGN